MPSNIYFNDYSTSQYALRIDPDEAIKVEFSRLIHAAVINKRFCIDLLNNPERCIETGYCGERFHFPNDLKNRIKLIRAQSLEEFSNQVIKIINKSPVTETLPVLCN